IEKIAVLAPMPRASDSAATTVTKGVLKSVRSASFRLNMGALEQGLDVRQRQPRQRSPGPTIRSASKFRLRAAGSLNGSPVPPRASLGGSPRGIHCAPRSLATAPPPCAQAEASERVPAEG